MHHINKDGLDGGVVYSEMQGTVYTSEMYFAMLKALYKGSGYDAYTGGKLKNLRETTTHKMVSLLGPAKIKAHIKHRI